MCGMAAFKEHCTFGFWKGDLVVGKSGAEESAHGQFGRITKLSDLPSDKVLLGHIKKAVRLNASGIKKVPALRSKVKRELVVPHDLTAALPKNRKALATFEGFSYSHQKEYAEWIDEAKREKTRQQRLKTAVEWMAAGKPRHWKYQNC